jgi:drug/metabolite transporter (DMT)-like permease
MQYASPSILAPFSGLTLVWIILFSEMLIGEKPLPKQMAAAALIILGEVVVAFFGDHTNDDDMTVQSVIQSYQQVSFQLYFIGIILWMYFVYTLIRHSTPSQVVRQRLGWGLAGGSVNGLQNFLKDSLTLIKASSNHSDTSPFPWILLISFILLAAFSAFAGLILLTACMKRYDALFSSAMFVGSFVISASIMSAIHYHTFQHLDSFLDGLLYCAGLCLLMVGVYILVEDSFDKEYDSARDDSDHILSTSTNASTTLPSPAWPACRPSASSWTGASRPHAAPVHGPPGGRMRSRSGSRA